MKHSLQSEVVVGKIAMVGVNANLGTIEHGTIFVESTDNSQKFFFHGGVIQLTRCESFLEK